MMTLISNRTQQANRRAHLPPHHGTPHRNQTTRSDTKEYISAKKSSIIQIAAQYQSDSEKRQRYESIVKERLLETDNGDTGNNRIIGIEDLRDGVATTLCRPCVEAKI